MDKKEYIKQLAIFLVNTNTTMTGETLATLLNWNNFKTSYNITYAGGRGTYTLIHATYDWLVANGNQADADTVALAFKKPDGTYAYSK
jgi:hypothetical protein